MAGQNAMHLAAQHSQDCLAVLLFGPLRFFFVFWFFSSHDVLLVILVVTDVVHKAVKLWESLGCADSSLVLSDFPLFCLCSHVGHPTAQCSQDCLTDFSLVLFGSVVFIILENIYFHHLVFLQFLVFLVMKTTGQSWLCCAVHLVAQHSKDFLAVLLFHLLRFLNVVVVGVVIVFFCIIVLLFFYGLGWPLFGQIIFLFRSLFEDSNSSIANKSTSSPLRSVGKNYVINVPQNMRMLI